MASITTQKSQNETCSSPWYSISKRKSRHLPTYLQRKRRSIVYSSLADWSKMFWIPYSHLAKQPQTNKSFVTLRNTRAISFCVRPGRSIAHSLIKWFHLTPPRVPRDFARERFFQEAKPHFWRVHVLQQIQLQACNLLCLDILLRL